MAAAEQKADGTIAAVARRHTDSTGNFSMRLTSAYKCAYLKHCSKLPQHPQRSTHLAPAHLEEWQEQLQRLRRQLLKEEQAQQKRHKLRSASLVVGADGVGQRTENLLHTHTLQCTGKPQGGGRRQCNTARAPGSLRSHFFHQPYHC